MDIQETNDFYRNQGKKGFILGSKFIKVDTSF